MKTVKNFLMSLLNYVYVKFNEPIKVAHLQKLANQSMLLILSVKARKTLAV